VGPKLGEFRSLVRLAIPIGLAQAGQALMNVVDTAVVGRAGAAPLAAAGLGNNLYFFFAVVGLGVMLGLDPLISQALGAGDPARAHRLVWQGAWLAAAVSAVLALPVALAPHLMGLFGIDPAVRAGTRAFMLARLGGLPAFLVFAVCRAYLQAHGRTRPLVIAVIAANICNVFLDIWFVFGGGVLPAWTGPLRAVPAMGAAGAGLSTTLCTFLQLAMLVPAIHSLAPTAPDPSARRPDTREIVHAARVGTPIGLHMAAEVGLFALVGLLAGRFGAEQLAAHQVALVLASFSFTAALGFGNAGSVRVGLAVGARRAQATRLAGLTAFASGALLMAGFALIYAIFPRRLGLLLTDHPAVLAPAIPLIGIAAVFQISDGVQAVGAGVLRGAGDTRFAFYANVAGHYAVGLPVATLLAFRLGFGLIGLWWGLCAGLTAVALALFVRFWRLSSRPIEPLTERLGS
jgi:MATE family multidrug resistance protein